MVSFARSTAPAIPSVMCTDEGAWFEPRPHAAHWRKRHAVGVFATPAHMEKHFMSQAYPCMLLLAWAGHCVCRSWWIIM